MHFRTLLPLLVSYRLLAFDPTPTAIHFTISRRGGAFPSTDLADMELLSEQLAAAEARFNLTQREIVGNKVVRKAKKKVVGDGEYGGLIGEVGRMGGWFAELRVGEPVQVVEMDLDMLTADFFLFSTTSRGGRGFTALLSQTFGDLDYWVPVTLTIPTIVQSNYFPFPNCRVSTDAIALPTINTSVPLSFVLCHPPKSSLQTLLPSGAVLGLAPSESLSQMKADGLLKQILEKAIVRNGIWSIMLINGQDGVFSIGGTGADAVKGVEEQTKAALDRLGEIERQQKESESGQSPVGERGDEAKVVKRDDDWKWTKIQGGTAAWWQILMQGVWIDGNKILKNQPVILDLNTPFILAPPTATKLFYASISGARRLPPPHSQFYTFPCLNPPKLHFEFGGGFFPAMQGDRGSGPGGRSSLGRAKNGSGYCVGVVVETRMGVGGGGGGREGAGNGLKDLWVVGEPFWRGVGGVFDINQGRVGMMTF
ncbi:MAG: hypothetical protein M1840_000602 [Geoglossum simile]|nr:MAG: hypothetical protein M1840_000602 [Geoglossum simile]